MKKYFLMITGLISFMSLISFSNPFSGKTNEQKLLEKLTESYTKSFIDPIKNKPSFYKSVLDISYGQAWQYTLDSIIDLIDKEKIDKTNYYSNSVKFLSQTTTKLTTLAQSKKTSISDKKTELNDIENRLKKNVDEWVTLRANFENVLNKAKFPENKKKVSYLNLIIRAGALLGNYEPRKEFADFQGDSFPGGLIYFINKALNDTSQNSSIVKNVLGKDAPLRQQAKFVFSGVNKDTV